jgi:hypothetical protein
VAALLTDQFPPVPRKGLGYRPAAQSRQCGHLDCNFNLLSFDGQRQTAFGAHLQAKFNGFADVLKSGGFGRTLAHATGNRGAFGHPGSGFVTVDCYGKFHAVNLDDTSALRKTRIRH